MAIALSSWTYSTVPPFPRISPPSPPLEFSLMGMQHEPHVVDRMVLLPTPKDSPQDHTGKVKTRIPEFSHEGQGGGDYFQHSRGRRGSLPEPSGWHTGDGPSWLALSLTPTPRRCSQFPLTSCLSLPLTRSLPESPRSLEESSSS